jgi:uncharacterized membrane protein YbhN (UPF0104 family)
MDRRLRFALQTAAFIGLTIAGGWWASANGGLVPDDLEPLRRLPASTVAWIVMLSMGLYVSDAWRYRTAARAIDVQISWATATHASIACNFFSCVTPGAAFGAPAALVMLARRGVSWELATVIAFGKSTVGSAMLQAGAFTFLLLGLGPALMSRSVVGLMMAGSGFAALSLGLMIAAGWSPGPVRRGVDRAIAWLGGFDGFLTGWFGKLTHRALEGLVRAVEQLRAFRPARLPAVLLSQLVYFACFIGLAVVVGAALGGSAGPAMWGVSTVYVAFLYVAPTPGGAGLAEGTAQAFFGALLPPASAVMTVLLFRALTFYLYLVVGVIHVAWVGGLGSILAEADSAGEGQERR